MHVAKTITLGDIELNYDQAVEDIRARRLNEKDEYEKAILQKIELALQGIKIESNSKEGWRYRQIRQEVAKAVIGAKPAREVASKLSDILEKVAISGEYSLEILNVGTSTLYHKDKEVEKLKKAEAVLVKAATVLRKQRQQMIFWIIDLLAITCFAFLRGE